MKIYAVGGSVRDALMGQPVADRDWVVVGATPDEMLRAGYQPVGREFPVFLHPKTHEEYALARTERKTAPGYHGFVFHAAPDVTLEQDLARRDLTINAIAQDPDSGALIDPYGGQRDLAARVLRHVGPAFTEDPVRILRVARFAARWPDYTVAPETMALMQHMVASGEADALVPERVMQELHRGLMHTRPTQMLAVLQSCGLIARLYPELLTDALRWQQACHALDTAANAAAPWPVRFALLGAAVPPQQLPAWLAKLRTDADALELAQLLSTQGKTLAQAPSAPQTCLSVLEKTDALRRPDRFDQLCKTVAFLYGANTAPWAQTRAAAAAVDAGMIAQGVADPKDGAHIAQRIRAARLHAIEQAFGLMRMQLDNKHG